MHIKFWKAGSAAEIFYDLSQSRSGKLHWFTRSTCFFPIDYSKLTLEMSTPDYIDYFYALPERKKETILQKQDALFKGINHELNNAICDGLDEKESGNYTLQTNCELKKISDNLQLTFLHTEEEKSFVHDTSAVILATGYQPVMPPFLKPLYPYLTINRNGRYKANRNYSIVNNNSIFIQNAEQATHGFNAADLSLGPYRNAVIINSILGREEYAIEKRVTFQTFGLTAFGDTV